MVQLWFTYQRKPRQIGCLRVRQWKSVESQGSQSCSSDGLYLKDASSVKKTVISSSDVRMNRCAVTAAKGHDRANCMTQSPKCASCLRFMFGTTPSKRCGLRYIIAETHGLLSNNHFGGRKGRSTVQALTVLQGRMYRAWKEKKVVSLIDFDVKGAFNEGAHNRLVDRLGVFRKIWSSGLPNFAPIGQHLSW